VAYNVWLAEGVDVATARAELVGMVPAALEAICPGRWTELDLSPREPCLPTRENPAFRPIAPLVGVPNPTGERAERLDEQASPRRTP